MNSITSLLFLFFVLFAVSQALQFEAPTGKPKCLKEELAYDVLVKGKYAGQSSPISVVNLSVSINKRKLFLDQNNHSILDQRCQR